MNHYRVAVLVLVAIMAYEIMRPAPEKYVLLHTNLDGSEEEERPYADLSS